LTVAGTAHFKEMRKMKRTAVATLAFVGTIACADRPSLTAPAGVAIPTASLTGDVQRTVVLSATVRLVDNPEICPGPNDGAALGHLQIRLTRAIDNPDIHDWSITGDVARRVPDILTASVNHEVVDVLTGGRTVTPVLGVIVPSEDEITRVTKLLGAGRIPSDVAERMISSAHEFVARFTLTGGGGLCGSFGIDNPDI
jgi:hypothetical protein